MMSSEVKKAQQIKRNKFNKPTIFDKIIAKEASADIIYEDEMCIAFNDIHPQAPIHFLVIPKKKIPMLEMASRSDSGILGKLVMVAQRLGKERAPSGFRLVVNNGKHGCQSIYHLHIHVIGGRQLKWPPTWMVKKLEEKAYFRLYISSGGVPICLYFCYIIMKCAYRASMSLEQSHLESYNIWYLFLKCKACVGLEFLLFSFR